MPITLKDTLSAITGDGLGLDPTPLVTEVARRLGCSREHVYRLLNKWKTAADALQDARDAMIDLAESALLRNIRDGDTTAIKFFLQTQGHARGYGNRQEIELTGPPQKLYVQISPDDWDDATE